MYHPKIKERRVRDGIGYGLAKNSSQGCPDPKWQGPQGPGKSGPRFRAATETWKPHAHLWPHPFSSLLLSIKYFKETPGDGNCEFSAHSSSPEETKECFCVRLRPLLQTSFISWGDLGSKACSGSDEIQMGGCGETAASTGK